MLLLDGKRLVRGRAFSSNGVSYPANWLDLTSREDHEAIGITYVSDPASWDQRWAWGYQPDGSLHWKEYSHRKRDLLEENNNIAGTLLAPTDYVVVRKYEKGTDISADVSSFRDEVRRINDAREAAINGTTTTQELYAIREFLICLTQATLPSGKQLVKKPQPKPLLKPPGLPLLKLKPLNLQSHRSRLSPLLNHRPNLRKHLSD